MWNWQTCGSLSRSSAPIGSSPLLTIFTVPLLPGPFGSAETGADMANAKKRIVAMIVRRDAALRISVWPPLPFSPGERACGGGGSRRASAPALRGNAGETGRRDVRNGERPTPRPFAVARARVRRGCCRVVTEPGRWVGGTGRATLGYPEVPLTYR